MLIDIESSWYAVLAPEFEKLYWSHLMDFVKSEYTYTQCFPYEQYIFRAFELTSFHAVKVVILGQDPYHSLASEK